VSIVNMYYCQSIKNQARIVEICAARKEYVMNKIKCVIQKNLSHDDVIIFVRTAYVRHFPTASVVLLLF
jgi:uncharacterized pyridoxal phosphate-containing UPF0001 family protein